MPKQAAILLSGLVSTKLPAQSSFTWQEIKDKFAAANPTLQAAEITAYLRPNPDFSLTADGVQIAKNGGVWRPLRDSSEAQVFNDVDSAYATLVQNLNLLRALESKYLQKATDVRDREAYLNLMVLT